MKSKLSIGNRVRVAVRFGETGKIVEILPDQPNPYGIAFEGMEFPLFYKAHELQKLGFFEKGFSWFRMKE
jgi:hypothetical protein